MRHRCLADIRQCPVDFFQCYFGVAFNGEGNGFRNQQLNQHTQNQGDDARVQKDGLPAVTANESCGNKTAGNRTSRGRGNQNRDGNRATFAQILWKSPPYRKVRKKLLRRRSANSK